MSVRKRLKEVGLDWTVRAELVKTESGIIIPKAMAIVREDNDTPLSVQTTSYTPFQNHELMELLDKVSAKTGLPIHSGGFFGDGEKVFIQLKSNDLKLGKDKVEGFITGINSFDGSTSLGFGNSTTTISCQNTFFRSYREVQSKVRHTKNMMEKVDEIARRLEIALGEEKTMFTKIKKMREVEMDEKVKELVVRALFDIDSSLDIKNPDDISTVTQNRMGRFYTDLTGELAEKGTNLWGLFSGVTKYGTHSLNKGNKDKNFENKLFGLQGERERIIFNLLTDMVS